MRSPGSPAQAQVSAGRTHRKDKDKGRSRTGCRSCRISKKKCDELRPICTRCVERSLECIFDRERGIKYRNAPRRNKSHSVSTSTQRASAEISAEPPVAHEVEQYGLPQLDDRSYQQLDVSPQEAFFSDHASLSPLQTYQHPVGIAFGIPITSPQAALSSHSQLQTQASLQAESNPQLAAQSLPSVLPSVFQTPPDFSAPTPCGLPHLPSECNCPSIEHTVSPEILAAISPEDIELINHYINIQSSISVACESSTNPFRQHFLPVALSLASAGQNDRNPSYHGLLACAATHRANLMGTDGHTDTSGLRRHAKDSRATAYKLLVNDVPALPKATVAQRERTLGGLCLLMFLAVLDGQPGLLPAILARYRREVSAMPSISFSEREIFFISVCSMWQTWLDFGRLASGHSTTRPLWDLLPASARPKGQDLVSVFAVPVEVCEQNLATYALVRRYEDAVRSSDLAGEIEVQLEAEDAESLLQDELQHDVRARAVLEPESPLNGRILNGRIMHHACLRVLLLREVLGHPKEDGRVQTCVQEGLRVIADVKWGSETGLLIPLLILALSATPRDRQTYELFVNRLCWKGSAGPLAVQAALKLVEQDASETWRSALVRLGSPILV